MSFDYAEKIRELTVEQRLLFYKQLARELTIAVRGIWLHPELSDAQKVDQMKCVNEIMHRVTAKISVTRLNSHEWTESDMEEMIKGWVDANNALESAVSFAILRSYHYVMSTK